MGWKIKYPVPKHIYVKNHIKFLTKLSMLLDIFPLDYTQKHIYDY